MPLTLEKLLDLEKRLEAADREIDSIMQDFYITPGAQNVIGNIGQLSKMHALLVEQLAEERRKLTEKKT